jgi:putative transposase
MIAGDHPHHRRQPKREMVQCEPNSKGDWPHLTSIADPAALDSELARIRHEYNTVRLHAGIGYVTPDDEHHGRGPRIRRARAAGMARARVERIKQNRRSRR